MPSASFFRRLKDRKLVQWALAYLAGAFVVFQAVEVLAEPWGLYPVFQRAIHVLLLGGLGYSQWVKESLAFTVGVGVHSVDTETSTGSVAWRL